MRKPLRCEDCILHEDLSKMLSYFFDKTEKRDVALALLCNIRDSQTEGVAYHERDRDGFIQQYRISEGRYDSTLRKLIDEGVLKKKGRRLFEDNREDTGHFWV